MVWWSQSSSDSLATNNPVSWHTPRSAPSTARPSTVSPHSHATSPPDLRRRLDGAKSNAQQARREHQKKTVVTHDVSPLRVFHAAATPSSHAMSVHRRYSN